MANIGKTPITGNFVKLDAISVVNGQAAYTMNNGGSAFTDYENVNQFLVSLNGILQAPTDSFTVSGSTLTFASNFATGDVIDFVIVLGNTLDIGTPSDSTVTNAKTNFVSTSSGAGLQIKGDGTTDGTLQLNCSQNSHGVKIASPAHSAGQSYTLTLPTGNVTADKFLKVESVSGSGTTGIGQLSFADAGGGLNLISTTTVSSGTANVDITSGIDSTYKNYQIHVINLHPSNDGQKLQMRFFNSSGIVTASSYGFATDGRRQDNTQLSHNGSGESYIRFSNQGIGYNSDESASIIINLFDPSSTTFQKTIQGNILLLNDAGNTCVEHFGAKYDGTFAVTGVRFYMTSGNIDSATIKLYGIS